MNFQVIQHHHFYHNNGFNPADNQPATTPTPATPATPPTPPQLNFNPFRIFESCFTRPPAPAPIYHYHYTFIYPMPVQQETQKTDLQKEHLVPQNVIKDDSKENVVPQDSIPAEVPVKTYSHMDTLRLIQNGQNALNTAFAELEGNNGLISTFKGIIEARRAYWNEFETKASAASVLINFGPEVEKQMRLDTMLLSILDEETDSSAKQEMPAKSALGLISSYHDEDAFSYKINAAMEKSDLPPLSDAENKEIKDGIMEILLDAEKREITNFLQSLSKMEKHFADRGYTTAATHYKATILEFKQIAETLSQENAEDYIEEWNALLKEFDPQHQLFLKLYEADKSLEFFSATMQNQLNAMEEKKSSVIFQEINKLTDFMKTKDLMKQSPDILAYISSIRAFIKNAQTKLSSGAKV
jgi:hypothetical protein